MVFVVTLGSTFHNLGTFSVLTQVKYNPSLPDNVKFCKVFENCDELSKFLQVVDEFSDMHIDQENLNMEESQKLKLEDKVGDQNIV